MTLRNLTEAETEVVFECLRCVATGEVFPNDWEFHTLFGIEFATLEQIVQELPVIDEAQEDVQLAINNSLNNLLGYPHGRDERWSEYISVPQSEVARIFAKRRAELGDDFEGIQ